MAVFYTQYSCMELHQCDIYYIKAQTHIYIMINKRRCTETPWDSIARTLARSHLYDDVVEADEILWFGELLPLVLALAG